MLNSPTSSKPQQIGQQHDQQLRVDQLLQAAKLIEQRALIGKLFAAAGPSLQQHQQLEMLPIDGFDAALSAPKLGEDYESRMLASKMRAFLDQHHHQNNNIVGGGTPNSTGSSRRSSPISATSSPSPDLAAALLGSGGLHSPPSSSLQHYQQPHQQFGYHHQQPATTATMLTAAATTKKATTTNHFEQQQFMNNASFTSASSPYSAVLQSVASSSSSPAPLTTTTTTTTIDVLQRPTSSLDGGSPTASASNGGSRRASSSRQSRAAHNELEKNRRANLRGHLEALKSVLPPEGDSHRDTTLSLLTRARNHIRFIDEQKAALQEKRAALLAENVRLQELLQQQQQGSVGGQTLLQNNASNFRANFASSTFQQEEEEDGEMSLIPTRTPTSPQSLPLTCNVVLQVDEVVKPPAQLSRHQIPLITTTTTEEEIVHDGDDFKEQQEAMDDDSTTEPNLAFLALNGLLPALPLLYPYSIVTAAAVGGTKTATGERRNALC